jgi:hypothetical protein
MKLICCLPPNAAGRVVAPATRRALTEMPMTWVAGAEAIFSQQLYARMCSAVVD